MADLDYSVTYLPVTLGQTDGKAVVMKTGKLVTTAVTADQVVLTYTVTAGKTLYLKYLHIAGYLATFPGNANPIQLGSPSLEIVAGTKVITTDLMQPPGGDFNIEWSEPTPVASATVIRVVTTPAAVTSTTWRANFGGFER